MGAVNPSRSSTLGGYELLQLLATGGMGEVYFARRRQAGGEGLVAVKLLMDSLSAPEHAIRRFIEEARIVARLRHPHVIEVLDVDQAEGQYFIAMEYIAGQNLRELLRDRALRARPVFGAALAARLFRDIADALAAVHAAGLVHRDVTPNNIMIGDDGVAKLIDFGVARVMRAAPATSPGTLKGKCGYMAPEYVRGQAYDHRADLFSIGVVMWETLTRRRLFRASSPGEQLAKLLEGDIPVADRVDPTVPRELAEIVSWALERDPKRRYPSAVALAEDLESAAARLPAGDLPTLRGWLAHHFTEAIAARKRRDRALAILPPEEASEVTLVDPFRMRT